MKVKELLSIKGLECFSITGDLSLFDAAKQMAECNIGALLVMDRGTLAGIVTERDIVKNDHTIDQNVKRSTVPSITECIIKCDRVFTWQNRHG